MNEAVVFCQLHVRKQIYSSINIYAMFSNFFILRLEIYSKLSKNSSVNY